MIPRLIHRSLLAWATAVFAQGTVSPAAGAPPVAHLLTADCERDFAVRLVREGGGAAAVRFCESEPATGYELRLTDRRAELLDCASQRLCGQTAAPVVGELILLRRADRILLLDDGVIVLRVRDGRWTEGRILWQGAGLSDVRHQPLGAVQFGDDFMRDDEELGEWQPLSGQWKNGGVEEISLRSLRGEGISHPEASKSVNAFHLNGEGSPATIGTGHWFWCDYGIQAAVSPRGAESVGVAAVQCRAGSVMLQWRRGEEGAGLARLIERIGSQERMVEKSLAALPYAAEQWYRLRLVATDEEVTGWVDDRRVGTLRDMRLAAGRAMLVSDEGQAWFDDVDILPSDADFAAGEKRLSAIFTADPIMRAWANDEEEDADRSRWVDWFAQAPVSWWVGRGHWGMVQRWACSPQWSFFGVTDCEAPVLWSKDCFVGDQEFEVYAANPYRSELMAGEVTPNELNLTICADGRDLASGYSFVYAGLGQRVNRLLRGDAIVCQQEYHSELARAHSEWCRLGLSKRGRTITASVQGKAVLSWQDEHPLLGGHVAVWSCHNGLLLARARVVCERRGPGRLWVPAPRPIPPPKNRLPTNDFERDLGSWTTADDGEAPQIALTAVTRHHGQRSLQVTNSTSGGAFCVWATRTPFDPNRYPRLRFAYRVPPEVKVNLYLLVGGWYREIEFTGPSGATGSSSRLGRIAGVATDGAWHVATFDLAAALSRQGLTGAQAIVHALAFAAPDHEHLRAGIGGNHLRATYWLDDFELLPLTRRTATPTVEASGQRRAGRGAEIAVRHSANRPTEWRSPVAAGAETAEPVAAARPY